MFPGQQKISEFDPVTSTQSGDIIPIVRAGQNKSITVGNFSGVPPTGWVTPGETWTYSAYSTTTKLGVITVPNGALSRYPNGMRVWFKQGSPTPTDRYGIVRSSTATTITLDMLPGYVLDNATVQSPFVSNDLSPVTDENTIWDYDAYASDFSTSEVYTGSRWLDGRPIYKKTINFGTLPNNTLKTVAHGISGLDRTISVDGFAYNGSNALPLPYATGSLAAIISLYVDHAASTIVVASGQDRTSYTICYVTLMYTKT